ncbi:inorganic diphosphatase [Bradyrhizobium sp. USDA 4486]
MTNYLKLPTWADKENILAVVETPRWSCCKLEFDRELRVFTLSKALMAKALQVTERKRKRNDRVVAVPQHSFFAGDLPDVRNLPATATEQLEKFFDATNALKSKKLEFLGWRGPGRAIKLINRCRL